ncbi:Penicillin-binding protein 4* [Pseudobythopirellula maris]|uniref:Penicillin-binding protein 4 n=1 Tax=Pseudobythopirellula maris TaxID=2527991 RepID=A0A5C5ZTN5_9BACT|nr:serine hydrolase domain-containing protein [Pseudobythopirellula maris]TWT90388.1 Penicillin-binding protein 4* [Pseudobythopirellula maris]
MLAAFRLATFSLIGVIALAGGATGESLHATSEASEDAAANTPPTPEWAAPLEEFLAAQLAKHQIPGASVAVVRQGVVLYARGFGYADQELRQPVRPASRFRIASLSKPLTATAVLRLVEAGELNLESKLLDVLQGSAFLPAEGPGRDERLSEVTIRHLLQHRAGWDRGVSGDPMFDSIRIATALGKTPPATLKDTIHSTLSRPLDFAPGERYCYSNFGYCLLGRVIEHTSGMAYGDFVQQRVLAPAGVTDAQLGRTLPRFRAEREVKYYDPGYGPSVFAAERRVAKPYGAWNLEAMDAHGGWIATASDMARYGSAYYGKPDESLLSASSLTATTERPGGAAGYTPQGEPTPNFYGLGWRVIPGGDGEGLRMNHLGSLSGASSLLVCQSDGVSYALLCNSRKSEFTWHFCDAILPELMELMQRTTVPSQAGAASEPTEP